MSRIQLALDVDDLDSAVAFYTRLLGTAPTNLRDGYAVELRQEAARARLTRLVTCCRPSALRRQISRLAAPCTGHRPPAARDRTGSGAGRRQRRAVDEPQV